MHLLLALLVTGCTVAHHPEVLSPVPAPSATGWDEVLARPGIIRHEAVLSARWVGPLSGLLNLKHPAAREAGLRDGPTPIVLAVHALVHPERGAFVVDTGVPSSGAVVKGLVAGTARNLVTVEPISAIIARLGTPLAGVLITHVHFDHVLGIPEIPPAAAIYAGPGELTSRSLVNAVMRPTIRTALADRDAIATWDFARAAPMAPFSAVIDVLGDGSLWAIHVPGHTPGSTAYLALTTTGPVLMVGDASHTWWGWDHGVEPGAFTADHPKNAESLAQLRAFAASYPQIKVYVGHELDGADTGVPGDGHG